METIQNHPRFMEACKKVAEDCRELSYAIRKCNDYGNHVTESQNEEALQKRLKAADVVERGEIKNFTIWQRVNQELTGECVAFLPK